MPDPLSEKQEFFAINGLRFFAAFWVMLFHASIHFGRPELLSPIQPFLDQGVLAMTLFFMLSGFVLSYRYSQFKTEEDFRVYFSARLARLYPVYIIMGLSSIWLLVNGAEELYLSETFGVVGYIFSVGLLIIMYAFALQAWFPSLFGVWNFGGSWSLSAEAFFYILFPKLRNFFAKSQTNILRIFVFGTPLMMFSIFWWMLSADSVGSNRTLTFYILPILRLPEFVFGLTGYVLFVERGFDRWKLNILAAISLVILASQIMKENLAGLIEYGWLAVLPFMWVFVHSLRMDAKRWIKQSINYLGRISYCVYMAQFTTIPILKLYRDEFPTPTLWIFLIF